MKTTALAALLLLWSASAASAECAWVIWTGNSYIGQWDVADAFETKRECDERGAILLQKYRAHNPPLKNYDYLCLPNGTDPREPKAKP
jgi:hypothetical protein